MDSITLADGLPAWEGAAVLFGSPGKTHKGRHFVHGVEAGQVHLGHQHFVPADALVLDLSHRPTALESAYRWLEAHGQERGEPTLSVGGLFVRLRDMPSRGDWSSAARYS